MQILYCGSGWMPIVDRIRTGLRDRDVAAEVAVWDRRRPLSEAARAAHVLLPSNAEISAEVIDAARELQLIQQPAAGVDGIDLAAARRRGVPVCNAAATNHHAVAEAALLLMLALARRFDAARAAFARREIGAVLGVELAGKTLGIIGFGRAGRALADIAGPGLGMHVAPVTSTSPPAAWTALYEAADVISIHCPLTAETRGLVGASAFARMKRGVLVVNCARGPVIDRAALEAALEGGVVAGVGLDTYWQEPWDPTDPLLARPDVIALPHVAGATEESFGRITAVVCDNIVRAAAGRELLGRVA